MTPEQIAKAGTEYAQQAATFCWCSLNVGKYPELQWYHAIKNEEKSGSKIVGARGKASGIKSGVSDTLLPVRRGIWSGLYIEFKRPSLRPKSGSKSKGGLSDSQIEFFEFVRSQGFGACVCYSWKEAVEMLISYLDQNNI